jgi:hypothetical protein
VPVVVPEDGEDGQVEMAAGRCQDGGLLGLAMRRQIAREDDEVGTLGDPLERARDLVAVALVAMDVSGRGDPDG